MVKRTHLIGGSVLLKSIKTLLLILGIGRGVEPVDVSKPIRNDRLLEILNQKSRTEKAKENLYKEIRKANLLFAVLADSIKSRPAENGSTVIEPGSKLIPLPFVLENGRQVASVFTDWDEIKKYSDQSVSTFILKPDDIDFMSKDGLCLNPATQKVLIIDGTVR